MGEEEDNLVTLPASDEERAKGMRQLITDWVNRLRDSVIAWSQSFFKGIKMQKSFAIIFIIIIYNKLFWK